MIQNTSIDISRLPQVRWRFLQQQIMTKKQLVIAAKRSILDFLRSLYTPVIMKNLLLNVDKNCQC